MGGVVNTVQGMIENPARGLTAVLTGGISEAVGYDNIASSAEDLTGINLSDNSAADRAIRDQENATNAANSLQERMYNQTRRDLDPWRTAGTDALGQMQGSDFQRDFTMADFTADPGYQFRMSEGQKAIERSAAAKGGRHGGATMKALAGYGQNLASQEYQNAYDRFNADRDRRFGRLSTISGSGQNAAAGQGAAAQNYATTVGSNMTNMANARASQAMGQAQQLGNMVGNASMAYLAFSDERLKTNIRLIPKEEMDEMKKHLKAYAFNYKSAVHGTGEFIGVMAQDLEKSKLGRTLVFEDNFGNKQIDLQRVMMLFLATMAEAS